MYFNKSIYFYFNYYDKLFMRYFDNDNLSKKYLYNKLNRKKNNSVIFTYPTFYKTVIGFYLSGTIYRSKRIKNNLNINQTLFLSCQASHNKFFLSIPMVSLIPELIIFLVLIY